MIFYESLFSLSFQELLLHKKKSKKKITSFKDRQKI